MLRNTCKATLYSNIGERVEENKQPPKISRAVEIEDEKNCINNLARELERQMAKVAIYTPTLVVFWLWPCWYYSEISLPRSHYLSAPYRHSFVKVDNIIFIHWQAVEGILFPYLLLVKLPLQIVLFHINTKMSLYLLYRMRNFVQNHPLN